MTGPAILRRAIKSIVASTILGGLLAAGVSVPAAAAPSVAGETHSLTVSVSTVSGTPMTGLNVYAVPLEDGYILEDSAGFERATAVKGKKGVYTFASLADTDHTLHFASPTSSSFGQFLGGVSVTERAEVVPASQSTLSVSIATNAIITGIVKSPTGKALPKARVTAYEYTGSEWVEYTTVRADSSGRYSLGDIDPGSYRLRFLGANLEYSPMYSGGATSLDDATSVVAALGTTATANATFPKGTGTISGTSKMVYEGYEDYGSFALEKGHAIAYPVSNKNVWPNTRVLDATRAVQSAAIPKSGKWSIKNILPGSYVVKIYPWYYNESVAYVGGYGLETATVFTVTPGSTHKGATTYSTISEKGGSLAVAVRTPEGSPISEARVLLQSDTDPEYYFSAKSDSTGFVTFGRSGKQRTIQPGPYSLVVTTNGTWAPSEQSINVEAIAQSAMVTLEAPQKPAGFLVVPTIAQTALTVGTSYFVRAFAHRDEAVLSYQWLRDGRPIYGADLPDYSSRSGDIGAQLSVRVTSRTSGYPTDVAMASVAGVVVSNESVPTSIIAPSMTPHDNAWVGSTLRVLPGRWSVPGLQFDFQWFRDGEPFDNVGDSYVVTLADLGSNFTATVTASKPGRPSTTASTPTGVVPEFGPATEPVTGVTVTSTTKGVAKGSTKFTAVPGAWTAPSPEFAYSWQRGGVEVATGATYVEKPTSADSALALDVVVRASDDGFDDGETSAIARTALVGLSPTELPVITRGGSAISSAVTLDDVLTVSNGVWARGDAPLGSVDHSFQWYSKKGTSKAVRIAGATSPHYTVRAADVGTTLSVTVTTASTRWSNSSVSISAGKVAASRVLVDAAPSVIVYGTTRVGDDLSTRGEYEWEVAGAKITRQWFACLKPSCTASSPISKFTAVPKPAGYYFYPSKKYVNARVFAKLTASKAGFATATVNSAIVTIQPSTANPVYQRPFFIANAASYAIGQPITVINARFAVEGPIAGAWQVCFADCLSDGALWAPATGAGSTSTVFTPDGANWGAGDSYVRYVSSMASGKSYPAMTSYSLPKKLAKGTHPSNSSNFVTVKSTAGVLSLQKASNVPVLSTVAQRWFVEGTEVSTQPTYTPDPADSSKVKYAVVTIVTPGYDDLELIKPAPGSYAGTFTPGPVSILGQRADEVLSLSDPRPFTNLPQFEYARWTYSYSWVGATTADSTGETFVAPGSRVGQKLWVYIYAKSPVYGSIMTTVTMSSPLTNGVPLAFENAPQLGYSGELVPGTTVTVSTPSYNLPNVYTLTSWQTSTDGTSWYTESSAYWSSFTPSLTQGDRMLRAVLSAQKAGHTTAVYTTDPVQIGAGDVIRMLGAPRISGEPRVGSTLTLAPGTWSAGVDVKWQWTLNGRDIPGATGPQYAPLATNAGDEIAVVVHATKPGQLGIEVETSAYVIQNGLAPIATKAPTISGTTTLTATPGVWNTSGLIFTFEWTRDGEVVGTDNSIALAPGTTKADYTLTVRTTRFGYEPGSWTQP